MKDLDKMTKEELKNLIKELEENKKEEKKEEKTKSLFDEYKEYREKNNKEFEDNKEMIREKFEQLLDGSFCISISSNRGVMQFGTKVDLMSCLAQAITSLLTEGDIDMDDVEKMFNGIKMVYKMKVEKKENINDELDKLAEMLESLNEMLGD